MAGQLTIDTLKASSGVLATQNGMTGIAKAWVQFAGVTTATINGSFNISSVTRTGTGTYTISFTVAMPNTNYSLGIATGLIGGTIGYGGLSSVSTTSFTVNTGYANITFQPTDGSLVAVSVFSA